MRYCSIPTESKVWFGHTIYKDFELRSNIVLFFPPDVSENATYQLLLEESEKIILHSYVVKSKGSGLHNVLMLSTVPPGLAHATGVHECNIVPMH